MPLNKKKNVGKTNRTPLPPIAVGTYMGRIAGVVDVGMQPQEDYNTKEMKPPKEVFHIIVEYPKIRIEVDGEDKPRWLSKQIRVSNQKNEDGSENPYYVNSAMCKIVDPLLGGEDNIGSLVNKPVMTGIGETSGGNAKIVTINAAPEEVPVPELENPTLVFDFYDPDIEVFKKIPKWMQKSCMEAVDYEGSTLETMVEVAGLNEDS